jgi:hypothetical protein
LRPLSASVETGGNQSIGARLARRRVEGRWSSETGRRLRNVDLVEATVKAVERAGGNLATAADVRAALAEIDATGS